MMQIKLINSQDSIKFNFGFIKKAADYILKKFDSGKSRCINIIFVGNDEIEKLNKRYRNIGRPTDVLSFSYLSDPDSPEEYDDFSVIGEIYISPEVALENSLEQGDKWSIELEIILLIIHGLLHIFGYDHEDDEERARMFGIQESMINDIKNIDWNLH
jgi:probable rRNA maturation factor